MASTGMAEVLAAALRRFAAEDRDATLLGGMPETLAQAARQLAAPASSASLFLEFPLAGPAHADMGLGFSDNALCLGDEATAQWPELAESIAWAAREGQLEDMVVAFDGDDLALGVRAAGLYFKHRGNMTAARNFLCQSGAADLADGYTTAVRRLSAGWLPLYAGNYHGRNHRASQGHTKRVVRLEAALEPVVCEALAHDAGSLNADLARLGFPDAGVATEGLSVACARLLALELPATVQLDVHEDGSLADTFGLTLFFTGTHNARMSLFYPDGAADEALRRLEALGVADGRWRHAVRGSFALPVPLTPKDDSPRVVGAVCRPDCVKLKWAHGQLAPARFYQVVRVAPLGATAFTS